MKKVNYFGFSVVVPDWAKYLAFERGFSSAYKLYCYKDEPEWFNPVKRWLGGEFDSVEICESTLITIRESGIKPSKSLVKV